eukprot:12907689-Prorocentrum_lima.AAC.1
MDPGYFPNQHVEICSFIPAFFVLPTAHCTFQVALARFSAGKRSLPGIACAENSFLFDWPRNDPKAS